LRAKRLGSSQKQRPSRNDDRPFHLDDSGYFRLGPKSRLIEMIDAEGPQAVHLILNLGLIFQQAYPEKD